LTFEFEAGEIADHDQIVWGEDVLVQSGKFRLPGKKALLDNRELEAVLMT
jgi:hypothetical protein